MHFNCILGYLYTCISCNFLRPKLRPFTAGYYQYTSWPSLDQHTWILHHIWTDPIIIGKKLGIRKSHDMRVCIWYANCNKYLNLVSKHAPLKICTLDMQNSICSNLSFHDKMIWHLYGYLVKDYSFSKCKVIRMSSCQK